MRLSTIHPGDIVHCDVRGRHFYATVEHREYRELQIRPITANISYYRVKSSEVTAHWHKTGRPRTSRSVPAVPEEEFANA